MKNELCRNIEIMRKHTFMVTKKIYILLCFQSFLCTKLPFLTKVVLIQGAFKNIQGLLSKIQGLFRASTNPKKLTSSFIM